MREHINEQQTRQRGNKPSILLSQEENDLVFSLLGQKCQVNTVLKYYKTNF